MPQISPNVLCSQKDARKLLLEETKKKAIASQLSAMRKNKTPAGSASQPPTPKKHKKDFGL